MTANHSEVARTIALAWAHIEARTLAGVSPEAVWRAAFDPRVWQAMQHVDAVAATGDVVGTQEACQAWNRAWRVTLAALRQEAA